jgi:hypothetical protein
MESSCDGFRYVSFLLSQRNHHDGPDIFFIKKQDVPPLSQNNGPTRESQTSEDDMDVEDGKITPHRHGLFLKILHATTLMRFF